MQWIEAQTHIYPAVLIDRTHIAEAPDLTWHYDNVKNTDAAEQLLALSTSISIATQEKHSLCVLFDVLMSCSQTGQVLAVSDIVDLEKSLRNNKTNSIFYVDRCKALEHLSWRIRSAYYGIKGKRSIEVFNVVSNWCSNDRLHVIHGHHFNSHFRADPCPGQVKTLLIELEVLCQKQRIVGVVSLQLGENSLPQTFYLLDALDLLFAHATVDRRVPDHLLDDVSNTLSGLEFSSLLKTVRDKLSTKAIRSIAALACTPTPEIIARLERDEQKDDGEKLHFWPWTGVVNHMMLTFSGKYIFEVPLTDKIKAIEKVMPNAVPGSELQAFVDYAIAQKSVTCCVLSCKEMENLQHVRAFVLNNIIYGRHLMYDDEQGVHMFTDFL